jgi:hypothetical protein
MTGKADRDQMRPLVWAKEPKVADSYNCQGGHRAAAETVAVWGGVRDQFWRLLLTDVCVGSG